MPNNKNVFVSSKNLLFSKRSLLYIFAIFYIPFFTSRIRYSPFNCYECSDFLDMCWHTFAVDLSATLFLITPILILYFLGNYLKYSIIVELISIFWSLFYFILSVIFGVIELGEMEMNKIQPNNNKILLLFTILLYFISYVIIPYKWFFTRTSESSL